MYPALDAPSLTPVVEDDPDGTYIVGTGFPFVCAFFRFPYTVRA